ncbi:uncharacterized protein LOC144703620 isoform X3 [Wolffia australiana]
MIRDQGPPDSLRQVVAPLLHMRKKGVGVCRLCDCFRFPPAITDKVYPIFLKRFLQAKDLEATPSEHCERATLYLLHWSIVVISAVTFDMILNPMV